MRTVIKVSCFDEAKSFLLLVFKMKMDICTSCVARFKGLGAEVILISEDNLIESVLGGTITLFSKSLSESVTMVRFYGHGYTKNESNEYVIVKGPGNITVLLCDDRLKLDSDYFCEILQQQCQVNKLKLESSITSYQPVSNISMKDCGIPESNYDNNLISNITNFSIRILHRNGKRTIVIPNARHPTPFENDLFVGNILFVVRVKPMDDFHAHFFSDKNRLYVIQLQGQFKKNEKNVSKSNMLFGIESDSKLDFSSRNICKAIMRASNCASSPIYYSLDNFNDTNQINSDGRSASVFAYKEMISGADTMHVTENINEKPPNIMRNFPESPSCRADRRRGEHSAPINHDCTYSFGFEGNNLDFCEWRTCGAEQFDVRTLIGNGSVRFVGLFVDELPINDISHYPNNNSSYFIEIELCHNRIRDIVSNTECGNGDRYPGEGEGGEESNFYELSSGSDLDEIVLAKDDNNNHQSGKELNVNETVGNSLPRNPRSLMNINWRSEDLLYSACCIEIIDYRLGRRRREAYICRFNAGEARLRSYMQLASSLPLLMLDDGNYSPRLSESEKRRIQLVMSLKRLELMSKTNSKLQIALNSMFHTNNDLDDNFLRDHSNDRKTFQERLGNKRNSILYESAVAICTGRRSWSEETLVLTETTLKIYNPQCPKHLRFPDIPVQFITSISKLCNGDAPFPSFHFMKIITHSRIYYFCVKNEIILENWINCITTIQQDKLLILQSAPQREQSHDLCACIVYPGNFVCGPYKKVLNHYDTHFTLATETAIDLCERTFACIMQVVSMSEESSPSNLVVQEIWIEFCRLSSHFQSIIIEPLSRNEASSFYMNLYHVMLYHGFIVLGIPQGERDWQLFKESVSYEVGGDIITLQDIDETILGNISNNTKRTINVSASHFGIHEAHKYLEKCVLENSAALGNSFCYFEYLSSHLLNGNVLCSVCDWRISMCLDLGKYSNVKDIVLMRPDTFEQQLCDWTSSLLSQYVNIQVQTLSIILPKSLSCLMLMTDGRFCNISQTPILMKEPAEWLRHLKLYITKSEGNDFEKLICSSNVNVQFISSLHKIIDSNSSLSAVSRMLFKTIERKESFPLLSSFFS